MDQDFEIRVKPHWRFYSPFEDVILFIDHDTPLDTESPHSLRAHFFETVGKYRVLLEMPFTTQQAATEIAPDRFYLRADNRTAEDSRQWGLIPKEDLRGIIDLPEQD